jgi:hypothetical protein
MDGLLWVVRHVVRSDWARSGDLSGSASAGGVDGAEAQAADAAKERKGI